MQVTALDAGKKPDDMNAPGWRLHSLTGDMKGYYTITVNANVRHLSFTVY